MYNLNYEVSLPLLTLIPLQAGLFYKQFHFDSQAHIHIIVYHVHRMSTHNCLNENQCKYALYLLYTYLELKLLLTSHCWSDMTPGV